MVDFLTAVLRFKRTTDSEHAWPVAPNLLDQVSQAEAPDQKWGVDISYIGTQQGWLYLLVALDPFSSRIVGWATSDRLHKALAMSAHRKALVMRQPTPGLIHHSDRGAQYCAVDYQAELRRSGFSVSMSGKGNCYDSAMVETFFNTALDREDRNREHLRQLRQDQKETEAAITRPLELVEKGLMDAEDPSMRERLVNLRFRRDELIKESADLNRRLSSAEPLINPAKIEKFARLLRDRLRDGPGDHKQAYVRLLLNEVRVGDEGVRISGSKAILARGAAEGLDKPASVVLSFV